MHRAKPTKHNDFIMSKINIIISQEYRNRVAKKSFLLLTFLMPILMAGVIFVPIWLASLDDNEERTMAVVDHTGLYTEFFQSLKTDVCTFDVLKEVDPSASAQDIGKSDDGSTMVLIVSDNLAVNPNAISIYSEKQVPNEVRRYVESELSDYVEHVKLEAYNIPGLEQMIADARTSVSVSTYKWDDAGRESSSDTDIAMVIGMVTTMLIYMFIFISGSQVMSAVVQEKSNRIVEVMVCSVKPWQMMWGKIIAVALTCFTQIALWAVMTIVIVGAATSIAGIDMSAMQEAQSASQSMSGTQEMAMGIVSSLSSINWWLVGSMFIVYFIGGYLLYSSLFAAIGSAVDNEQDTNQFMMPITIIVLFALYAGIYSAENPDGPLAFWCSMIPFTSPIVMMVRLPFDVPVWQLATSLALLALTVVGAIWISAKIYRIGILMYGKKPSWSEIAKWLRY